MLPYADFSFFGLLLIYVLIPTVLVGLAGRANAKWSLFVTVCMACVILAPKAGDAYSEWVLAGGYAVYQGVLTLAFLRWKGRATFYVATVLSILPLAVSKFFPLYQPDSALGFIGISYVTFRALDVIFSIRDNVIKQLSLPQFFGFLFFFPTLSSGPIDRYRRFGQDWNRLRGRHEFLEDLDAAVSRVFQGFLYKYLIAALIKTYWVDRAARSFGFVPTASYMYAYTFYLFFDFAGYSAFAIGISRLFGIRSPENFDKPFLSRNIRDFWNRWHISLSFWFRDHVYMRFLLTAAKGKWFKGKHTASYLGLFLTFGLMGIWHGPERHYLIYGAYHASLLCGYDAFNRWNKQAKVWKDGPGWRAGNILLTFHAIAFGLLIFSGRLTPHAPPKHEEKMDRPDCHLVTGFVWDADKPNSPLNVEIWVDDIFVIKVQASEAREDLRQAGYGDGRHGFTFALPAWVRDGRTHKVDAKVAESQRQLRGAPENITCAHE